MRAQTTLPVLGVALVLITAVSLVAMQAGSSSIERASEPALDRATAVALSERLVSNRTGLTVRANVLNRSRFDEVDERFLRETLAVHNDTAVRLRVGNRTLVEAGTVAGGTTVERIVLSRATQSRERRPAVDAGEAVTVPRRVSAVTVSLAPGPNTSVRTVLAGDRVVLRNQSGLRGRYRVRLSRFVTTPLTFDAVGTLNRGDVVLRYAAPVTRKATLEVTVDG